MIRLKHILIILMMLPTLLKAQKIVATTTFIKDICQNIAGNKFEIISLMPIGGDPHIYEPIPQDAQIISEADLIFKNGLFLEGWLEKLIDNSGTKATIITLSKNVIPIQSVEYHGSPDPHAWMTVKNAIIYAQNALDAFIQIDPNNKGYYIYNHKIYKAKLDELDSYITQRILSIPKQQRILVTSHDAFKYFGRDYGLSLESALGISTEAEVQISDMTRLTTVIKQNKVPAVFIESTINPKLIRQLAQDLGITIGGSLFADSLGDEESGADTYLKMMKYNTDLIVAALKGDSAILNKKESAFDITFVIIILFLFTLAVVLTATNLQKKQDDIPIVNADISVKGLSVSYDRKTILNNIYLDVLPGKLYGILGPNGAGKSTLLKSILGLIPIDVGTVLFKDTNIEQIRKYIAYIPQKEEVDWHFPATVYDVVLMGRYPHKKVFGKITKTDNENTLKALDLMGILELKNNQIGELSGGQQQRVFIARALCQEAEVYLFDEPFVGVDITTEEKIIEILKDLASKGKTLLVIHHDLSKVKKYFDSVILLNQRIVAAGNVDEVFTDENIQKTYSSQFTLLQESEKYIYDH